MTLLTQPRGDGLRRLPTTPMVTEWDAERKDSEPRESPASLTGVPHWLLENI